MNNKKIIFAVAILILILLSIFYINQQGPAKTKLVKNLLPNQLKFLIKEQVCDYRYFVPEYHNERIFPQTQFLKLNYNETKIKGLKPKEKNLEEINKYGQIVIPFYIETFNDESILIAINGTTLFYETPSFIEKKSSKNFEIKNNLPSNIYVDGTVVFENKLFVSFRDRDRSCGNRQVYVADVNFNFLQFNEFYSHGEIIKCEIPYAVWGGQIAIYNDNGSSSLIISTNYPNNEDHPLLKNYNKKRETIMMLINLNTKKSRPFTAGHRNPQGLFVNKENIIISTEHGPRGGDEINQIIEGNNYGWPSRSYGEGGDNLNPNHAKYGFIEPIYAFIPSVAISQIIKVPEEFSPKWQDSYLITTLKGVSIYRVIFDEKYSRVITKEKIRIGKRIRDITYNKKYNSFLLALENESGSVGTINIDK